MALFENNTTTDLQDLLTKLNTFFTTGGGGNPGWTADRFDTPSGEWAMSKDSGSEAVEVSFQWDTGSPGNLGVYQYHTGLGAGNYNSGGGTVPYDQDGDSGNGAASTTDATLATARHVALGNSPVQYWAFASSAAPHYGYVVVETAADTYVMFGWGVMDKGNSDYTGGEFCCGYKFLGGVSSNVALQALSSLFLDGILNGTNMELFASTIHLEGFSDTPASGLWTVCMGNQNPANLGNDRQGSPIARTTAIGGCRAGTHAMPFGQFVGTINMGLIPTYPIVQYYLDRDISGVSATVGATTLLGTMPDVRGIMLKNFQPQQEVEIDGDTWIMFPSRKRWASGALTNTSGYQGMLFKKN